MADEGTGARLAIDRSSDGAFIGWCSLTRWNPDYRSASLGYCVIPEFGTSCAFETSLGAGAMTYFTTRRAL